MVKNSREPIVAHRIWRFKNGNLISYFQDDIWIPGKIFEAYRCVNVDTGHSYCPTGIFSFKNSISAIYLDYLDKEFRFQHLSDVLSSDSLVESIMLQELTILGEVYQWGRIFEHENGYRSEFAYPKKFYILENTLEQKEIVKNLANLFGVECDS